MLSNYSEAIKQYDKTLIQQPADVFTLVEKGKPLTSLGNFSEAIDYYDRALRAYPVIS